MRKLSSTTGLGISGQRIDVTAAIQGDKNPDSGLHRNAVNEADTDKEPEIPVSGVDTRKDNIDSQSGNPEKEKKESDTSKEDNKDREEKKSKDDEEEKEPAYKAEEKDNLEEIRGRVASHIDGLMSLADFIELETKADSKVIVSTAQQLKAYRDALDKQIDAL